LWVRHTASIAQSITLALLTTVLFLLWQNPTYFSLTVVLSFVVMLLSFPLGYYQFYKISWLKLIGFATATLVIGFIFQTILITILTIVYFILIR